MRLLAFTVFALSSCAHTDIALNGGTQPVSGTSIVSNTTGLQVNASGGAAAAFVAAGIVTATVADLRRPAPAAVPPMDPSRTVSEQDCSKPIEGSGNLRCR